MHRKIMKNVKILLFAFIVVMINACGEDFLSTEPMTTKTDANYYTTPAEAQEALVGCYDGLQLVYSAADMPLPLVSEVMSDMCFSGFGTSDNQDYQTMDEYDKTVDYSMVLSTLNTDWIEYYTGIYRCNVLLGKIDGIDWTGNESLKAQIEAEAHFLRAYFYFDMVRIWERIPLLTAPTSDNIPQADPDSTYSLIVNDLIYAIENGRSNPYPSIASTDYGHADKWAAEALLARVYLFYTGFYGKSDLLGLVNKTQALAYVEDIITNGGFGLIDNFADLWLSASRYEAVKNGGSLTSNTYAGENNKEIVFSIKYTYTSDANGSTDGNHWLVSNGMRGTYDKKYGYAEGWGGCSVLSSVYSGWPSGDTRRDASIIGVDEEGILSDDGVKRALTVGTAREYTGYYTKKYIPLCDSTGETTVDGLGISHFMYSQYQDYFVFRYSDVLLMAAELGSANAVDYVNQVRLRANPTATPYTSVDKDIIYEERRLELAFEGIRYYDLLRYDNTLQYAADKVSFSGTVKTSDVDVTKTINGQNLINTRGLLWIPYTQMTLSGGLLTQNKGWEQQ
jgi:starch-binding outer membrane protein, SusD/RagB family